MVVYVHNLDEARKWFLKNSSGTVICVGNGIEKECKAYSDAVDFFRR